MEAKVYMVERNHRGGWVIYGTEGVKQYYGCTKKEAMDRYKASGRTITARIGGRS
jgi:hypothetical protein